MSYHPPSGEDRLFRTFGVITSIVFDLTSIQSLRSKVNGSLAIMIRFSRLSALVMRYMPSAYSSNDVPEEKNNEAASHVRDVTYRMATTVSPSETT